MSISDISAFLVTAITIWGGSASAPATGSDSNTLTTRDPTDREARVPPNACRLLDPGPDHSSSVDGRVDHRRRRLARRSGPAAGGCFIDDFARGPRRGLPRGRGS